MFREFEERLELYKNENVSLKHRINELENLNNLSRQNVTQSDNQRNLDKNSSSIIQKIDVHNQVINLIIESIMKISSIFVNIAW